MKVNIGHYHPETLKRECSVTISDDDLINLDVTLAMIIAPALREFKLHMPMVMDDEDLPSYIPKENANSWLIDELIWTFETIVEGNGSPFPSNEHSRIQEGLKLFAKYFRSLWI